MSYFIAGIKGDTGPAGANGIDGSPGANGTDGANGVVDFNLTSVPVAISGNSEFTIVTKTFNANTLIVGKIWRFRGLLRLSNQALATTFNFILRHNGNNAFNFSIVSPASAQTNKAVEIDILFHTRSIGSSGVVYIAGIASGDFAAIETRGSVPNGGAPVNTTINNTFALVCNFSISNGSNVGAIEFGICENW